MNKIKHISNYKTSSKKSDLQNFLWMTTYKENSSLICEIKQNVFVNGLVKMLNLFGQVMNRKRLKTLKYVQQIILFWGILM